MIKKVTILIIISIFSSSFVFSQQKQHLLGLRAGYNISGMDSRPDFKYGSLITTQNFSIVYTYYHSLWGTINNFGFQTGVSKLSLGFEDSFGVNRYEVIRIPLVSQFHVDFWRMRFLINAGGFGGYRMNRINSDGSSFDEFDNKTDLGFTLGTGFAFILKPFEIHLEGNYHYSLTYLHDPKKYSQNDYLFTYPKQLIISLTLNIQL